MKAKYLWRLRCNFHIALPLALATILVLLTLGLVTAQKAGGLTRITTASDSNRDSLRVRLSADGTIVAFDSDSDFLAQGIPDGQGEIWLYDTATMTYTRITTASHSERDSWWPDLSAGGTVVVFQSDSDFLGQGIPDGQDEIWLYDTTAMVYTRVTTASHGNRNRSSWYPSLSADGAVIAFRSDSDFLDQDIPDNQNEIWLYDTTTMTYTRVTTASHSDRSLWEPRLNADGSVVVFSSESDYLGQGIPDNQYEIWLYDTAMMTLTRITTASHSGRDSLSPKVSADGTVIAFHSDSDFLGQGIPDGQDEIWLYDTTTMTYTRVTTASHSNRSSWEPSLSADGTLVAFESDSDFLGQGIPDNQYEIWLYDATTMILTRITTTSHDDRDSLIPSLNGGGTIIAFQSDSDFLDQGILDEQVEIWLFREYQYQIYLPLVLKQTQ